MATSVFFARDRRHLSWRLSFILLLSIAAHLVLMFGVRGIFNGAGLPQAKKLEARLVTSRGLQSPAVAAEVKTPLQKKPAEPRKPAAAAQPLSPTRPTLRTAAMPAAGLPLPFDPVFYTWREVDVTAKLQGDRSRFPLRARLAGISGRVMLEVWVDETGKVSDAKILEADPPGYFEEATLAHYRALSFFPAMKDGSPRRYRGRFLEEFGEPSEAMEPAPK
jgi:TonB family protein